MWARGAETQSQAPAHRAQRGQSLQPLLVPRPRCYLAPFSASTPGGPSSPTRTGAGGLWGLGLSPRSLGVLLPSRGGTLGPAKSVWGSLGGIPLAGSCSPNMAPRAHSTPVLQELSHPSTGQEPCVPGTVAAHSRPLPPPLWGSASRPHGCPPSETAGTEGSVPSLSPNECALRVRVPPSRLKPGEA